MAIDWPNCQFRITIVVILLMAFYSGLSSAQLAVRPGDEPLQIDVPNPALFEDTPYEPSSSISRDKSGLSVWVRTVEIAGSSVYEPSDFRPVVQPFLNRELDTAGLAGLVQAVTQLYVQDGYLSSGAVLPDQDLNGGAVVIQVIEGRLAEVLQEAHPVLARRSRAPGQVPPEAPEQEAHHSRLWEPIGDGVQIAKWNSELPQPTEAEIETAHAEWQAEYDAQEYASNRKNEYPTN